MITRQIKRGQKFIANSKGKPAYWIVTRRVKTDEKNLVYCRVTKGCKQSKKYTGKQFGKLIKMDIIKLKNKEIK